MKDTMILRLVTYFTINNKMKIKLKIIFFLKEMNGLLTNINEIIKNVKD